MASKRYVALVALALTVFVLIFAVFFYNAVVLKRCCRRFFYDVVEKEVEDLKREIEKSSDPTEVIERHIRSSPLLKGVFVVYSARRIMVSGSFLPERYVVRKIKVGSADYELYFDAHSLYLVNRHILVGFMLLFFTSMVGAFLSGFLLMRYYRERLFLEKERAESERAQSISLAISAVLHEVKNILNNINLLVYKIKKDCPSREVSLLYDELKRLSLYMDEVSDLRKPLALRKEQVDIGELVDDVISEFEDIFSLLNIKVEKNVEGTLLAVDPYRMKVALRNLIKNAVEALSSVEDRRLKVEGQKNGDFYVLRISDNASALSPYQIDSLFLPYKTKGKKGFGVGLFNVKRIVEAHGGMVSVELRDGYTTFLLKIPLKGVAGETEKDSRK